MKLRTGIAPAAMMMKSRRLMLNMGLSLPTGICRIISLAQRSRQVLWTALNCSESIPSAQGAEVRLGSCVTSIAGPHGGMQLYER